MWNSQRNMGEGWFGSGGALGTRAPDLRIKHSLPLQVELSVPRRAVAQVKVNQALVGDADLFGDSLEVGN